MSTSSKVRYVCILIPLVRLCQARALFREEGLPPEEATSLQLPALLARVRAVASERRSREEQLELELEGAITAAREAKGVEGESRGAVERLRAEVDALSARLVVGINVVFVCSQ